MHDLRLDQTPAIGQVLILAFQEDVSDIVSLDELETLLIIKPNASWDTAYFKFPGGMLQADESFEAAALRELAQETGAIGDAQQIKELCRTQKRRHAPHDGTFDIVFYAAFGCDFREVFESKRLQEFGDEGEVVLRTPFKHVATEGYRWLYPTDDSQYGVLFPRDAKMLRAAVMQVA